ncbi:YqzL family protein [Salibacterium halotolerans]|uniref:YqzL-like protein n=1 Tax=Salibacterium halotolerans TaxID=1884432 RepID=A0A1I5NIC3_9BACI|nr:YqzL family protein [Salibacterium halotolerans]SFP20971.1 YqzL-like protein [Salibacterium halotolerans]
MLEKELFPWDLFYLTGNIDAYLLTKEMEQHTLEDREEHPGEKLE